MSVPFHQRNTSVCPSCKRRPHIKEFFKWVEGRFIECPTCKVCEPGDPRPAFPDRVEMLREQHLMEQWNPVPKPKVRLADVCPGCKQELFRSKFRKWWHGKRVLRDLCIACEPGMPAPDAVLSEARVRRDAEAKTQRRVFATTAARRVERKRAWADVLRALRAERDWCFEKRIAPTVPPAWRTFFEAYEAALSAGIARAVQQRSQTTRTYLYDHEQDPMHWLYPETKGRLKELYAVCPVVRGRRSYRDPLFLGEYAPPASPPLAGK